MQRGFSPRLSIGGGRRQLPDCPTSRVGNAVEEAATRLVAGGGRCTVEVALVIDCQTCRAVVGRVGAVSGAVEAVNGGQRPGSSVGGRSQTEDGPATRERFFFIGVALAVASEQGCAVEVAFCIENQACSGEGCGFTVFRPKKSGQLRLRPGI